MHSVNNIDQSQAAVFQTASPHNQAKPVLNFAEHVPPVQVSSWQSRAIAHLDNFERRLDDKIPNSVIQNKIDALGREIEKKFAPFQKFNDWLEQREMGAWYRLLALFLVKLPLQAARNIVRLLYCIIKSIFSTAVHPLKATVKLAKLLVSLAHALTKPETWSKMGAGMLGTCIGQSLVSGNPLSVIGMGIGAAMIVAGLSVGTLKKALEAEKGKRLHAAAEQALSQAKELPEAALTGFLLGLIVGGIQRTIQNHQLSAHQAKIDEYARQFIKTHQLPPSSSVSLDPATGKITVVAPMEGKVLELAQSHPKIFYHSGWTQMWYEGVKIEILPTATQVTAFGRGYTFF